jgi:hypothetical protein
MATRKLVITKPARAARKGPKPTALPDGYQSIGGFHESWEPEKAGDNIEGTWQGVREVMLKKPMGERTSMRAAIVITEDGVGHTVWESAALRALFDEAKVGDAVYICFDGLGAAVKGRSPMKMFTCGLMPHR